MALFAMQTHMPKAKETNIMTIHPPKTANVPG